MITIPDSEDKLILLAPMAGVTDKPFRRLCRRMGAHACVSEMITSDVKLYGTRKSRLRRDFSDEGAMTIVQIAGADPERMAEAALRNIDNGADIIDINRQKKSAMLWQGHLSLRTKSWWREFCVLSLRSLRCQ